MDPNPQSFSVPFQISSRVEATLNQWQAEDWVSRFWQGDASLWTARGEDRWLGWLRIVGEQRRRLDRFSDLSRQLRAEGFTHAVLLGMGGSSLCPEVLGSTFGGVSDSPVLSVLDSTVPSQVRAVLERIDHRTTLFIVSSKSGTTLESRILMEFFLERLRGQVPVSDLGRHWIAITDPGSELEATATGQGFRAVYHGRPDIGGRFSALSDFGMVPAAVMGLDVGLLLERAARMVEASGSAVAAPRNPGVVLGVVLGACAAAGRDKVTIVASPEIAGLGAWLEQLLAESTGKNGKGLIPVDGEALAGPESYGNDRVFVYLRLSSVRAEGLDSAVARLEEAGHAMIRIDFGDRYDLGQEFFRWEVATASAGAFMRLNPFDQPDVEASKVAARKLTARYEAEGALPVDPPIYENAGIRLFASPIGARPDGAGPGSILADHLREFLSRIEPGDYFAVLAYMEMKPEFTRRLEEIRHAVGVHKRVATSVGFGPRFLHSTGQVHKGGPNTGVFLQITTDDIDDLEVPGRSYTFGVVKAAQASGDFSVLAARGRRLMQVHLGRDVSANLGVLSAAVLEALQDRPG